MNKRSCFFYLSLWLWIILPVMTLAQITFPAIIGDNMVLQQKCTVPLWGKSAKGKIITITPSWNNKKISTVAGPDGEWKILLETPSAGGPYTISINDTLLNNILIGEVWLCSGQSNMQMKVSEARDAEQEIHNADNPSIRFFTVARQFSEIPKKNCYGRWLACSPETAEDFSAAAYFFGRELSRELKIPIGLINASWGGTPAEAWTSNEILRSEKDLEVFFPRFEEKVRNSEPGVCPFDQNAPSALYNAMIAPLIPFTIRGVIWYQGEANVDEPGRYEVLFPAMIKNWRSDWATGDFPFYYVQIAPFDYEIPLSGALLRDAQKKTLSVANTGMVVTMDIGDPHDIHPLNKQEVGKRLAVMALARDYGRSDLSWSGPVYNSLNVEQDKIRLNFLSTANGLVAKNGELKNFEIADVNEIFVPASAVIQGNSILVYAPQVKSPVAVRYAFKNTDEASLFNTSGLPSSSFRTDDWPVNIETTDINGILDTLKKDILVSMSCKLNPMKILYTTDGNEPNRHSDVYSRPFHLNKSAMLRACAYDGHTTSTYISSLDVNFHIAFAIRAVIKFPYSNKYKAGGAFALTDGMRGSKNYLDGNWQGYLGDDLEAVIDLVKEKKIQKISVGFLQSLKDWIFFPLSVEVFTSSDGHNYTSGGILIPSTFILNMPLQKNDFTFNLKGIKARYIKVKAISIKECPEGHPGHGSKAWMFADEILVE